MGDLLCAEAGKVSKVSDDVIRILYDVHHLGLTVLWSYLVPLAKYDDGREMPLDDWRLLEGLWRVEHKTAYFRGPVSQYVTRMRISDGVCLRETIEVLDNGEEYTLCQNYLGSTDAPDEIIEESVKTSCPIRSVEYSEQESDYLSVERVKMDEYYEESVGLVMRYKLTDLGVSIIDGS